MKKLLVFILSLFLITSCSKKVVFDEKNYEEVSFKTIEEKIKNKETFVYYIGSDTCSSCEEFNKSLSKYFTNHNDYKIYYVDVNDNFAKGQEYESYRTTLAEMAYILDGTGEIFNYDRYTLYTPTIFKVINGEYSFAKIGTMVDDLLDYMFELEYNNINYVDNNLNYDNTIKLLNGDEDFNFFFTQDGCPNCLEFKLILNSFDKQEKDIKLYNMTFSNDIVRDEEKMFTLKSYLYNNTHEIKGTIEEINAYEINVPTTIKKRGDTITIKVGIQTREELIEFFK